MLFVICVLDPMHAKLIAQKSKGMPLISISLEKLVDSAANDAMENMSFGLFKAFKLLQNLVLQGCLLFSIYVSY